jgi:ABC-type transport system involved in multi-copper enzyme maturation permease subunit
MNAWWQLSKESFLMLRRDRIFLPIVIAGFAIASFSNLASGWGIESFEKILFDLGLVGFRLTGGIVAILWGVRLVTDPLQDRSIELRIATPASRVVWLLGRYTGLAICLIMTGVIFAAVWQLLMFMNQFGTMNNLQSWSLGMLLFEWLTLGAIGLSLGTLSGFSTALFVSFALWITGLIAPVVAATLDPTVAPLQKNLIDFMAKTWNFQRFNLVDQVTAGTHTVIMSDLLPRLTWAGCVMTGCIALACLAFQEKDLT